MFSDQQQAELQAVLSLKKSGEVHDPDFFCFRNMADMKKLSIIDVGANRGQSIVSFKAVLPDAQIVSFEANTFFGPVLNQVADWYDDVRVFNLGLGRTDQLMALYVPVVDGKFYWEEGSIRPDSFEKPWVKTRLASYGEDLIFEKYIAEIRDADSILQEYNINWADIVKIDVEGAELDVLIAMKDLVTRAHPILMIENSDWHNVTAWLKENDYICYQYVQETNKLVPLRGACTNSIYLPAHYSGPLTSALQP